MDDTRKDHEPRHVGHRRGFAEGKRDHRGQASDAGAVKVIEVRAESEVGWEDAVKRALAQAGASLEGVQSIHVKDQRAIVRDGRIAGYRVDAEISFVVEPRVQGTARARLRDDEPQDRGEENMPNREHDDSQYGRYEGRFESREEQGFRDQSNRGSRDWDRRGDDFRSSRSPDYYGTQGYGEQRRFGGDHERDYGQRASSGRSWYDERREAQRLGSQEGRSERDWARGQDWGHSQDYGRGSQDYGRGSQGHAQGSQGYGGSPYGQGSQGSYGQGSYGQGSQGGYGQGGQGWGSSGGGYGGSQGGYGGSQGGGQYGQGQGWGSQGSSFGGGDFSRTQSNYGARDATFSSLYGSGGGYGQGQSYGQGSYGQGAQGGGSWGQGYGDQRGRDEESWGEQIRHAGQQVAQRVKRVFRGPKGYKRSDERIREDVSDRLAQLNDLDPTDIEVQVANGEVTLTGTVQSRREKWLAEEISDDVSGVNEVNNQLRVRREDVSQTASTTSQSTTSTSATGGTQGESRGRNARA